MEENAEIKGNDESKEHLEETKDKSISELSNEELDNLISNESEEQTQTKVVDEKDKKILELEEKIENIKKSNKDKEKLVQLSKLELHDLKKHNEKLLSDITLLRDPIAYRDIAYQNEPQAISNLIKADKLEEEYRDSVIIEKEMSLLKEIPNFKDIVDDIADIIKSDTPSIDQTIIDDFKNNPISAADLNVLLNLGRRAIKEKENRELKETVAEMANKLNMSTGKMRDSLSRISKAAKEKTITGYGSQKDSDSDNLLSCKVNELADNDLDVAIEKLTQKILNR